MATEEEVAELREEVERLRAQNKLLEAAIEASPAGILVATAPDGVIRVWNSAALGIREGETDALTAIPVELHPQRWQTFHPDGSIYAPEDLPLSRALLRGEVVTGDDVIIRRSSGEERWVTGHAAPVRDESGAIVAGVVVFPDITERKNAEQALARFRSMAESTSDFIGVCTPDFDTMYVNPGGRQLCEIPVDMDLTSWSIDRYHPKDVATQLLEEAFPTAISEGIWRGESALLTTGGELIPVSQILMSHRDGTGQVTYLSTTMRDLRPIRQLEAQLQQSQRLESIGRLAGGIAHDFNNMLTVVDNYVRFVLRTLNPSSRAHSDLSAVLDASDRAALLCRQLLGFARQQVIAPRTVDLNDLLHSFEPLIRPLIGEDVVVTVDADPDVWPVKIDPSQFDQVLANLAVNARDAMPRGGRLRITTKNLRVDADTTALRGAAHGDYVHLRVSDDGSGIAQDDLDHIFEPFFSTKGAGKGTGLGLATVHGAVKQNHGHITVHSELGVGTTFDIYLPRVAEPLEHGPEFRTERGSTTGGETLLVVEDEASVRRMTVRVLEAGGYCVLSAADADEAEAIARDSDHIALCITDVVMPGRSGPELARDLAEILPDARLLYMSGYAEDAMLERGVLEGNVAFMAKPFRANELLRRVRQLLDGPAVGTEVRGA